MINLIKGIPIKDKTLLNKSFHLIKSILVIYNIVLILLHQKLKKLLTLDLVTSNKVGIKYMKI
jgi:hypothetical protein